MDSNFAVLPPHFALSDPEIKHMLNWNLILPGSSKFPDGLRRALPHLLASLVFHLAWLRNELSPSHPIFQSFVFSSGIFSELSTKVLLEINRCDRTGMSATGIPPHLTVANETKELKLRVQQMDENLSTKLPVALTEVILSKFSVNGALPVTREDITGIRVGMKEDLSRMIHEAIASIPRVGPNSNEINSSSIASAVNSTEFDVWNWGGIFHMIPEGWTLPRCHVKELWNCWNFGHSNDRIQPYRRLKPLDLVGKDEKETVALRVQLSRTRTVMEEIEKIAKKSIITPMSDLNRDEAMEVFDQAFEILASELRLNNRCGEMGIGTIYNAILKKRTNQNKRKRKRGEREEEEREEKEREEKEE
jgi:hypothetical protein